MYSRRKKLCGSTRQLPFFSFEEPTCLSQWKTPKDKLRSALEPYLVVRGLEEWIEKDFIEEHFREISEGAAIEYIEIEGTEAMIMFHDSQGT